MEKLLKDALEVETVLKKQIKTLTDRNTALERAIAIYLRDPVQYCDLDFDTDEEAVRWFYRVNRHLREGIK